MTWADESDEGRAATIRDEGMASNPEKVTPMNSGKDSNQSADIQPIREPQQRMAVSEELGRLTRILREVCPPESVISFEYDGALRLNIDVRRVEDVARIEALLPSLCGGIFHGAQRRLTARHSFFHRISAIVSL